MNTVSQCLRSAIFVLAMAAPSSTVAEDAAAIIVHRLRQSCSIAEPGKEQAAYETCRAALFADERLQALSRRRCAGAATCLARALMNWH